MQEFLTLPWGHIADRFVIHFISAAGVLRYSQLLFWWLEKSKRIRPLAGRMWFIVPGGAALMLINLREVYDVAIVGDSAWKSLIDWFSWLIGLTVASRVIVALDDRTNTSVNEIRERI